MINVDISLGDYFDRLTILMVKSERCIDDEKRELSKQAVVELGKKASAWDVLRFQDEIEELYEIHKELWTIEDEVRNILYSEAKGFTAEQDYLKFARKIPELNDKRASIKRAIDEGAGDRPEVKDFSHTHLAEENEESLDEGLTEE